jgi:hypothetical protein
MEKELKTILTEREYDVIIQRINGITLNEIGEKYCVTRERIRQIEKNSIRKVVNLLDVLEQIKSNTDRILRLIKRTSVMLYPDNPGDILSVKILRYEKEIYTLEQKHKYNKSCRHKSISEKEVSEKCNEVFDKIKKGIKLLDSEMRFADIDKRIQYDNIEGYIATRRQNIIVQAKAILRQAGRPLHYMEIHEYISKYYQPRSIESIHNALLIDDGIILAGNGLYALPEWGYSNDTVGDLIEKLLKVNKEMNVTQIKGEILSKKLVKPKTINQTLITDKRFKRIRRSVYSLSK